METGESVESMDVFFLRISVGLTVYSPCRGCGLIFSKRDFQCETSKDPNILADPGNASRRAEKKVPA
jgi:hypothetical protein